METEARLSWFVIPNFSSVGKSTRIVVNSPRQADEPHSHLVRTLSDLGIVREFILPIPLPDPPFSALVKYYASIPASRTTYHVPRALYAY